MNYEPEPIRTDSIRLDDNLQLLTELLAENIHDVWACGRREHGWRYGAERNDALKTHPGLVPYAALSEIEKDFDRNTVIQTLKAITALGYRIVATEESAHSRQSDKRRHVADGNT